jgi:hypothetical protein
MWSVGPAESEELRQDRGVRLLAAPFVRSMCSALVAQEKARPDHGRRGTGIEHRAYVLALDDRAGR